MLVNYRQTYISSVLSLVFIRESTQILEIFQEKFYIQKNIAEKLVDYLE